MVQLASVKGAAETHLGRYERKHNLKIDGKFAMLRRDKRSGGDTYRTLIRGMMR
jgi:hypothetical protein